MTQTTSERIEAMLGVHYDWTGRVIEAGVDTAARKIAAEIDALRDEMAVILRERNDAHLALAERTRERDEALAEIATLTLKLANARLNLKHCSEGVDKRDECAGQLAESRAEVERLRPAAEAWEARQAWYARGLDDENLRRLFVAMTDADSRAIAAKEARP